MQVLPDADGTQERKLPVLCGNPVPFGENHIRKRVFSVVDRPILFSIIPSVNIGRSGFGGCFPGIALSFCLGKEKPCVRRQEFRMALDDDGSPGYYDLVHPCYTVFHKDTETFSCLWTAYTPDYESFCAAWENDMAVYGNLPGLSPQSDTPKNTFPVSMLPWSGFEGFNLNLQNGYDYLPPIFTMGRFYEENGKVLLPLAVQVHHAVCDGFHLCRFIRELQELLDVWGEQAEQNA